MLYPLMPVFLNTVLGAPAAVIGIIEGAAEGTMAFIKLISDKLNKFLPRKLMVFAGYASATTGSVIIALSLTWPFVLFGRVVDRFGKGLRSAPRDAILMRGTEPRTRGRIIGFHRSMDTAGAVIGPILTLMLLAIFDDNIRAVLWWAVVPAVASTLLVLFIKDGGMRPGRGRSGTADEPRLDAVAVPAAVSALASPTPTPAVATPALASTDPLPPKLRRLITVLAIFSLVNFPDALLLLHLSLTGFSPTEVVAVYLVFNVAYALLSFPVGLLADRLGSKYVYAFGLLCFAVTYAGLALTDDWMIAVALLVVYGGFSAANDTVGKSWAAKLAPAHLQLKAQARLQGFSGFGILIAGIWAGLAWNAGAGIDLTSGLSLGDGGVPLLISAAFAILVAIYVAIFAPRSGFANKH
jgi:MFS family permease